MVIHANELNSWEKGSQPSFDVNEDAPQSGGGTKPNAFNRWADPNHKEKPRDTRPVDQALREALGQAWQCVKCGFKTSSEAAKLHHLRENSAGQILCERERAAFREQEKCSACGGEGISGPKMMPCATCSGVGFVPKKGQDAVAQAPAIDADALAAKITASLSKTLNDGFASVVAALRPQPEKAKKQKGKSDDGRPRGGRGGAQPARPAPGPVLGQPEQPVADPSAEPAEPA